MTEPVLFKKGSFLVVLMTLVQAILPAIIALMCLYACMAAWGNAFDKSSPAVAIAGVLCLILVQAPRQVSSQLTNSHLSAASSVFVRWLLLICVLFGVGYVTRSLDSYPRKIFLTWALVAPPVLMFTTVAMQRVMQRFLLKASDIRQAVFAGYNESSLELAARLKKNPALCLSVCGFFDDRGAERLGMQAGSHLMGRLSEMAAFVKSQKIDVIFIALPIRHLKRVLDMLDDLRDTTASIYYVPDVFVADLIQARSGDIQGVPVVAMCETPFNGYRGVAKRISDVVISASILLLASPVLLATALAVKMTSPGPVIFKQRRYGLDGREINVYKFRSMNVMENGSEVKQASQGDTRMTKIGAFLRRSSLDELPQLINVLQGRMSLVGPRPHAVAHNEQYRKLIKGYMIRHKVLPGITGLAQVNGCRGETARLEDMEARVKYDLDYLRRWSPMLDFKIMWQTLIRMIFGDEKAY
ncbi:MAG: undecaprenyl-phosphate glucose phosphotransferase [Povalibacter sp.]